ncbi:response regulator transcription factor [Psychromonas sp.]|nr:response regulator transcription factor [Psychromonas sp.]
MSKISVKNILIADDHELFVDGIGMVLHEMLPDANIYKAFDFNSMWEVLHQVPDIDLVMMDLKMPNTKGLDGVRAVRDTFPSKALIVLSSLDYANNVSHILSLGVNGFISKSTQKAALKQAIQSVLEGHAVAESQQAQSQIIILSKRQRQTLHLMSQGKSNKDIAQILNISPNTAKEYVSIVIKEMKAENRMSAVKKAEESGLLFDIDSSLL